MVKPQLLLIIMILMFGACDPYDTRLTIVNNSNDTILLALPEDGRFKKYPIWIDSITQDTLWTHTDFITPHNEMSVVSMGKKSWEDHLSKHYKDSTLIVFIFDKEFLKSTPSDSLVSKQLYTKKYAYKVRDLEKLNWRVEYK